MKEKLMVVRILMEKMKRKKKIRVLYLGLELKEKKKELREGVFCKRERDEVALAGLGDGRG